MFIPSRFHSDVALRHQRPKMKRALLKQRRVVASWNACAIAGVPHQAHRKLVIVQVNKPTYSCAHVHALYICTILCFVSKCIIIVYPKLLDSDVEKWSKANAVAWTYLTCVFLYKDQVYLKLIKLTYITYIIFSHATSLVPNSLSASLFSFAVFWQSF